MKTKGTESSTTVAIHRNTYFFGLYRFQTESQNITKLRQLQRENIATPIDFFVGGIPWTERLTSEIIETFQFYGNKRWNEGRFHTSLGLIESVRFHRAIYVAIQSGLFRRLRFGGSRSGSSNLGKAYATTLAEVFRNAVLLDRVTIYDFDISHDAASILVEGLVHENVLDTLGPRELVFDGNRFTSQPLEGDTTASSSAAIHLATGLARNKTLELLTLKNSYLDDETLALLFQSLVGHPSIQTLLITFSDFGPETIQSLQNLLSHPTCQLHHLELSNHVAISRMSRRSFDMFTFILSMPVNNSLKCLCLTKQGLTDKDVNMLLQNLWRFPQLTTLDLQLNQILDLDNVTRNLCSSSSCQLRALNLDYNDCFVEMNLPTQLLTEGYGPTSIALVRLLQLFPQLAYLGQEFLQMVECGTIFPPIVQHHVDMNYCGGFLLHREVPLSLWPLVLGKAKELERPSRQANVLYHLLRDGPAFCGRDSL